MTPHEGLSVSPVLGKGVKENPSPQLQSELHCNRRLNLYKLVKSNRVRTFRYDFFASNQRQSHKICLETNRLSLLLGPVYIA